MRAVFVVNPAAGGGRAMRRFEEVAREARARGIEVVERITEGPGHATVLARDAIAAGEPLVVAVGGDGTVNEVANGFRGPAGDVPAHETRLAVVECGTGCDFIRTHGIPKRAKDAVAVIARGRAVPLDLGRARFEADSGQETRLFANHASCGLTADVARRVTTVDKRLGGTLRFLWATAAAFTAWQNVEFRIRLDAQTRQLVANNVICANGRYFAGGMKIAPGARADDGLLDVLVIGDVGKLDLARNVHRLYRGTLARHPRVEALRARSVEVETARQVPVEIDGEQPGTTPITFDVLPAAVELLVP